MLAPLCPVSVPPPEVLVVARTLLTTPAKPVVALVAPVLLLPVAVDDAVACCPFAVAAVADALAVPVVDPVPPVAVAVVFDVALRVALRLVVVPVAVAMALPPVPEVVPGPPAAPPARACTVVR